MLQVFDEMKKKARVGPSLQRPITPENIESSDCV